MLVTVLTINLTNIHKEYATKLKLSLILSHQYRRLNIPSFHNCFTYNFSLPHECALRDSHAVGLIEPNAGLLMFCAFCYGWLDGTLNTQLIALIGSI